MHFEILMHIFLTYIVLMLPDPVAWMGSHGLLPEDHLPTAYLGCQKVYIHFFVLQLFSYLNINFLFGN